MEKVRVMIADKQNFFRSGLRYALSQEYDLELLDCDPDQHLIEAVEDQSPDVLILDIDYPSLNGLRLSKRITRRFPNTGVIVLSPNPNEEELIEVVRSGAAAYLSKNTGVEELVEAIKRVSGGEYPIDDILADTPDATEQVLREFRTLGYWGELSILWLTRLLLEKRKFWTVLPRVSRISRLVWPCKSVSRRLRATLALSCAS